MDDFKRILARVSDLRSQNPVDEYIHGRCVGSPCNGRCGDPGHCPQLLGDIRAMCAIIASDDADIQERRMALHTIQEILTPYSPAGGNR